MKKLSRLLVMAIVVLAVITMSLEVHAAGKTDLTNYVTEPQIINGMIFELTNSQKTAVRDYIAASVSDAQASSAYSKIKEAEKLVAETGADTLEKLSADVKSKVISLAVDAAKEVGLTLNVNTKDNTFSLSDGSKVLASGKADSLVIYQDKRR